MGSPSIAESPYCIFMAVENAYFSIHGACGASVTIAVEGNGLDQILMAVFHNQIELHSLLHDGRFPQSWWHLLYSVDLKWG